MNDDGVAGILYKAHENGVSISLNGDGLKLKFDKAKRPDPKFLSLLKGNKQALIDFLRSDLAVREGISTKERIAVFDRQTIRNIPLSFAQERLWFIDRLQGSTNYHIVNTLHMKGLLNKDALVYAICEIVNRHEVLRTVFREEDGEVYQVLLEKGNVNLQLVDGISGEEELKRFIHQESIRPFDLSRDPMLRAHLVVISETEHIFVLVLHHIATDGWSQSILIEELSELYEAKRSNRTPVLSVLPVQYADYSVWQRNYLSGEVLERKLKYWETKLSNAAALHLPLDYSRPVVQSVRGSFLNLTIDRTLSDQLQVLAGREGVTLFMLLLTVFKVLLHRYSGQTDISVGSPTANRSHQETEPLIGFFVNTLVLRSDLSGNPVFKDLLSQVKRTTLEAYTHQDVPFEKIVERVEKSRDMSRSPLFQVMFSFQNTTEGEGQNSPEDLALSTVSSGLIQSKFDLSLDAALSGKELSLSFIYCLDLFAHEKIKQMMIHYEQLLKAAVTYPNEKISVWKMLAEEEEHRILKQFNDTVIDTGVSKNILELFEEQADLTPQHCAVIFEGEQITYQELNGRSGFLALDLIDKGIKPGCFVPIVMSRGIDYVVSVLAILKTGAGCVPLSIYWPSTRLKSIFQELGATVILSNQQGLQVSELQDDARIMLIDYKKLGLTRFNLPRGKITLNSPIYVYYTSGTTGKPKGVILSHKGILNRFLWMNHYFGRDSAACVLRTTKHIFDSSIWQIFWPLINGGKTVIPSEREVFDLNYFTSLVNEFGVTMTDFVPALFNELVKDVLQVGKGPVMNCLKDIVIGGEAITVSSVNHFRKYYPRIRLTNLYGPTEASIGCIAYKLTEDHYTSIPIGRPISNTKIFILDRYRNPQPVGVEGELNISGTCLAKGYFLNTVQTEKSFVLNTVTNESNDFSLLYRTGDLARWLPDGNIEYLGRLDDQVKIRGYRIELGEIESVLEQHPGVKQCAVVIREDLSGDKKLTGYIVPLGSFDRKSLHEYLRSQLPQYMVPPLLVELKEMPLTSSGKINKKGLPDPEFPVMEEHVAPANVTEEMLVRIWSEVLHIREDQISINDNFFELGGHSLLVIRVVSHIRKDLKKEVSVKDVFMKPTIRSLGFYLSQDALPAMLPPMISLAVRPSRIPLSFSQERLWFIDRLQGSTNYHLSSVFRLKGPLEKEFLEAAFRGVINRHEVLRTVFKETDGEVYQQINEMNIWSLQYTDAVSSKDVSMSDHIHQEVSLPFDLSKDPMVRARLVKLSDHDHLLIVVIHHIATDGWSQPLLIEELTELYEAQWSNRAPVLKGLPVQYADYSVWQRNYLSGEVLEDKLKYLEGKLSGAASLDLPSDYIRPAVQSTRGSFLRHVLDKKLSSELQALAGQEGVTLFMLLLTVFKVLLHRYSGQSDISVGSPTANRSHQETEPLIGFFVNTLVLRSDLSGNPVFKDLLSQVKRTTLEAYTHQDVPFEKIVERVEKSRDMSRSPLFQVMFILQNLSKGESSVSGGLREVSLSGVAFSQDTSKFDLTFAAEETSEGLVLGAEYCTDLFSAERVRRMIGHYEQLLISAVSDAKIRIDEMKMISNSDEVQLTEFNASGVLHPGGRTMIDLFEEHAQKSPDRMALITEGFSLTYSELNMRVNQVAHYLKKQGVGQGSLTGICIGRSPEMIIGLLGIQKAGGACVPIDPEYPGERIRYMIRDSDVSLILTSEAYLEMVVECSGAAVAVCLDSDWDSVGQEPVTNPGTVPGPEDAAYVIYTSGSTGRPKGVMVDYSSLMNLLYSLTGRLGLSQESKLLGITTYSFDVFYMEMYAPLILGGRMILADREAAFDTYLLKRKIAKYRPDYMQATPVTWQMLLDSDWQNEEGVTVLSAGEAMRESLKNALTSLRGRVFNLYGPTETTVYSSSTELSGSEKTTIGKPLSNTQFYILDGRDHLLPVGIPGELCIGGAGLARGYLNKPELTAIKFMDNPFGSNGTKFYRTGDLAQWLPDGNIEYLGRLDDQVKIRGYRIELGEIESVLEQHPGVKQCAVVIREDLSGDKKLTGYIVPLGSFDRKSLHEYLRSQLPQYMVPPLLVELKEMPLTSSGKINKKGLPDPEFPVMEEHVAPANVTEEMLVRIWSEVLHIREDQISINDNFFELGGHSLVTIRLVSAMRKTFKVEISVRDVFIHPNIKNLALHIARLIIMDMGKTDATIEITV